MKTSLLILAAGLLAVGLGPQPPAGDGPAPGGLKSARRGAVVLTDEGRRLHGEALVFDGHNDLAWHLREQGFLSLRLLDLRRLQKSLHTDLPRLRKGGVGAQFWSAWVPTSTAKKGTAVRETLEQIDLIHRLIQTYPDTLALALTADDVVRVRKEGKIASLIGIEGGHSIDNSLAVLRMYHRLGARYLTLTHSDNTDWADSATDAPRHNGLTEFGEQVVAEMNRLGMLVDIAHVSAQTMRHVLRVSKAPVIASHSSAYALAAHPRNVPDDVLRLVAKNGGVVMVNFFSGFVVPEGAHVTSEMFEAGRRLRAQYADDRAFRAAMNDWHRQHPIPAGTIHHVVNHIEHIIRVAGVDHVGLGSDFDGVTQLPRQLEDVSCYPFITQELLNRGHSRGAIRKVLGANLLRVLRQAQEAPPR